MMEKIYNVMKNSGIVSIVIGIVMIILGLATGIVSIIYGSKLLLKKDDIVF
jgi:hypothetical protein